MGVLGSKEDLGQLVVVYGYNANDFPWRDIDSRSVYHVTGLIVGWKDKKYVITTRQRLVGCKHIVMYHSYFHGIEEIVMRNDLSIIFQSIDFNVIILGTQGHSELNLAASKMITGDYVPKIVCPSYDIFSNTIFPVPTKKSHYYTIRMSMDLESATINYRVHIYDVKFVRPIIYDRSYVPDTYMYEYCLKNTDDTKLFGICGATVFNKKYQLVGIISRSEGKSLFVLPTRALTKVFLDFIYHHQNPNYYHGPMMLPFSYGINSKKCCVIKENSKFLKKDDIVISLAGRQIETKNGMVLIYDDCYKEMIPLDMYITLNFDSSISFDLEVKRNNKIFKMNIFGKPQKLVLPLTDMPYFYSMPGIPYLNINGIIIVKLSHELLDMTALNKKIIQNSIIKKYFRNETTENIDLLLIIDCLDNDLAKKYDLPQLYNNCEKQTLYCPFVTKVNEKVVSSLTELEKIVSKNSKIMIQAGVSFKNQQMVAL